MRSTLTSMGQTGRVLPVRSTLEGWRPDSLTASGAAVRTAGESIHAAVSGIDDGCERLAQVRAWSGPAHDAAAAMFNRAEVKTRRISDYAAAIAQALNGGAESIGRARDALLNKADELDAGPLNVTEQWVVLIDPVYMSAEEVEKLHALARTEQAAINSLLAAVGDADESTADAVVAAGATFGFVETGPPTDLAGAMLPTAQRPPDQVPDPESPVGMMAQEAIRSADEQRNVREVIESTNSHGEEVTTVIKQDGSKAVTTRMDPFEWPSKQNFYEGKDRCIAFIAGVAGGAGGWGGAEMGASAGLATGPFAPVGVPLFAVIGAAAFGWGGAEMGKFVGDVVSVLELPEPAGWRGNRASLLIALVFGALLAAAYAYLGVLAAIRGNYLTTVVAAGWTTFLGAFVVALLNVRLGRTTARTTGDASGLTVLPDRRFSALLLVGIVAALPSTVLFAVYAPTGAIDFATTRGLRGVLAVAAGLAAVTAIWGLVTAWRRGGVGHVKLTPAMVESADILATRLFEWDDIVDVSDHAESRKARRAVVLRLGGGKEEVISMADIYLPRGAALYWLVRHYWRHPEDRAELVDERAGKRLSSGAFDLT